MKKSISNKRDNRYYAAVNFTRPHKSGILKSLIYDIILQIMVWMRINDCKIANNIRAFRYKTTEIYVHIAKEYCTNNFVSQ